MSQCLHKGVKFQIIDRISALGIRELLTEKCKCNWVTLLAKNSSNAGMRSITSNFKDFVKIWKLQYRGFRDPALDFFKSSSCCTCPFRVSLFQTMSDASHNIAEISNEPFIESGKSVKATNFSESCWNRPIKHSLNLGSIHFNTVAGRLLGF